MFNEVLDIIKKAGVFLILAQTLLHLCVSDSFEKYIKMLVGIIAVMMLALPLLSFFKKDEFQSFETYQQIYEDKIFGESADFEKIRDEGWELYLLEGLWSDENR